MTRNLETLTRRQWLRDAARMRRREPDSAFWPALAVVGSIGWPIAVFGALGALLARYLHDGMAALSIVAGVLVGCGLAFSAHVRRTR